MEGNITSLQVLRNDGDQQAGFSSFLPAIISRANKRAATSHKKCKLSMKAIIAMTRSSGHSASSRASKQQIDQKARDPAKKS